MVYLRARWYDAGSGRFGVRDPFAGWEERPDSLHPYLYTGDSPINYVDPSGQCYGPFRSFRNVEFTKCRDLDKAMAIWYAPQASHADKALAFTYISLWSFGAVAGVAAVPVTAAAGATAAGASGSAVSVGMGFGATFDLVAQLVTTGDWSKVNGLQTVFSASTGMLGTGVGAVSGKVASTSFWGRVAFSSSGSGVIGAGMTAINNIFSCEPTNPAEAFVWSAAIGGVGSGIGNKLEAASISRSSRLRFSPALFGSETDRALARRAMNLRNFQPVSHFPSYSVGIGTVVGEGIANAAPLGQLFEFIVAPNSSFDDMEGGDATTCPVYK
jgi:hypothetical protein